VRAHLAATRIQRAFRRHLTRTQAQRNAAAVAVLQRWAKTALFCARLRRGRLERRAREDAAVVMQAAARRYFAYRYVLVV
jgi:hypothetical protein